MANSTPGVQVHCNCQLEQGVAAAVDHLGAYMPPLPSSGGVQLQSLAVLNAIPRVKSLRPVAEPVLAIVTGGAES